MSFLSRPTGLVIIHLHQYPASLGIKTVRISPVDYPVALPGAFFEPRLSSLGPISRAPSDADGNYTVDRCDFEFDDEDGELGALLDAGESTEFWIAREIAAYLPSSELLDTQPNPESLQPVFRGWITDVQREGRVVRVAAADVVGAMMSASNLDRKVLQIQCKDLTATPLEETKELYLPIYIGEFSDRGSTNSEGTPAVRGIIPVIEVCEIDITNIAGAPAPAWSDPPVITAQSVHGVSGQERRFYGATLITPYGESSMSNIVECNGASVRNMSNYNEISGTFENGDAANPNKVRIWYGPSVDHMVGWLDEANYSGPGVFGYYDGAANWPSVTRDENDIIKYMDAPLSNNAQNNPNIFSVMSPCIGYGYDFLDIFGSNLADGAEPARAVIPAADHGSTTITNKDPQWPFPDPWIELNGVKITAFLQRGPKLQHHRDGSVTMSCNLAGPFDNAGKLIDQAFRQWMFLLNEHCVKNNGTGFRNGTYGTLERYANGDALIKTEDFEKAQEQSKLWTGDGVGYQGNIWITDPEETWRDVLQKLCQSFGARFTATRFGQMKAFLVPTEDDGATGLRHFREKIEIKRSEKPQLAHDEVINKGKLSYFWDPDLGDFRGKEIPVINETSIAQQVPGGVPGGKDKRGERPHDFNLWYTAYATTATDVVAREMMRRKRRPRYPSITLPLLGLDYDIGDICKLTDSKGLGAAGDVGIKVQILKHETHPNEDEVTLVFQDLRGIAVAREVASAD